MTPPPTGTFEVATLGPLGAFAVFDADGFGEVAWAVGDGDVGAGVSWAAGVVAGVAEGVPLSRIGRATSQRGGARAGQGEQSSGPQYRPALHCKRRLRDQCLRI